MKLDVCFVLLLLVCCLRRHVCRLPEFTPATPRLQVESSASADAVGADRKRKALSRLPGLCGRLKRRRVTILCNLQKFCWPGRSRGRSQSAGQVCRCPRGSRCSHFFVHSP